MISLSSSSRWHRGSRSGSRGLMAAFPRGEGTCVHTPRGAAIQSATRCASLARRAPMRAVTRGRASVRGGTPRLSRASGQHSQSRRTARFVACLTGQSSSSLTRWRRPCCRCLRRRARSRPHAITTTTAATTADPRRLSHPRLRARRGRPTARARVPRRMGGAISARSRRDLGAISARSRRDPGLTCGIVQGRSRRRRRRDISTTRAGRSDISTARNGGALRRPARTPKRTLNHRTQSHTMPSFAAGRTTGLPGPTSGHAAPGCRS